MRLALLLIAVTLVLAAPASAATAIDGCRVPDSATVEAVGGRLVVWSVRHRDRWDDIESRVVACRRSSGARVVVTKVLESFDYSDVTYGFAVAGDHVAYAVATTGRTFFLWLTVFDARHRRVVRRENLGFHFRLGGELTRMLAVVVSRSGAVATVFRHLLDRDLNDRPRERVGLRAFDAAGRRLLDKGDGIDPASLRLEGSTVHWTNAGEARSAPLR